VFVLRETLDLYQTIPLYIIITIQYVNMALSLLHKHLRALQLLASFYINNSLFTKSSLDIEAILFTYIRSYCFKSS
jgi:hypothetical protein